MYHFLEFTKKELTLKKQKVQSMMNRFGLHFEATSYTQMELKRETLNSILSRWNEDQHDEIRQLLTSNNVETSPGSPKNDVSKSETDSEITDNLPRDGEQNKLIHDPTVLPTANLKRKLSASLDDLSVFDADNAQAEPCNLKKKKSLSLDQLGPQKFTEKETKEKVISMLQWLNLDSEEITLIVNGKKKYACSKFSSLKESFDNREVDMILLLPYLTNKTFKTLNRGVHRLKKQELSTCGICKKSDENNSISKLLLLKQNGFVTSA